MKDLAVVVSNDNQGVTPYETIDAIVNAGFKNVFLQWYDEDYKKFEVPQLEQYKYVKEKGLNVIFNHLGYRGINNIWLDGNEGEELVKKYIRNLDEMKEIGVDLVVMHICVGYDAPPVSNIGLARFKRICEYAKKLGIKIAFENTKVKGYQEYILDNIDLDNIGICYDSGHAHCHFKDDYDFKRFKDRIMCVHIHDNYGEIDDHLIPYDGTLDFDMVLRGLKEANYSEYLTLELCYRNEYTNMDINDFYKKGYDVGMTLKKKYKEVK